MPTESTPPPLDSAPLLRKKARIWLYGQPGRRRKGRVIIEEVGGIVKSFTLPADPYSLIFALAEKAVEDLEDEDFPRWSPLRGFLTKDQLQKRVESWGISGWYHTKLVYKARQELSEIDVIDGLSGKEWSHEIIETSDLGHYRLSVPPENIFIETA